MPFWAFSQDSVRTELQPEAKELTSWEILPGADPKVATVTIRSNDATPRALIYVNGEPTEVSLANGSGQLPIDINKPVLLSKKKKAGYSDYAMVHAKKTNSGNYRIRQIPLWMAILPPLLAIGLALLFKEVVVSLFVGILSGAWLAGGMSLNPLDWIKSLWHVIDTYILKSLNDGGHLSIIVFSLLIGGMVAIISRNGGMAGVVQKLSRYAKSPRSAQFITWLLGIAIFFDDYANTLIVGNTMRNVTDRFKISREKLAYIVDSTAAPISALAFVTTWIGFELGQIESGLNQIGLEASPYSIFISSLKYSFYPILTLIFILILIYLNKDFSKMYTAEHRARIQGIVKPKQGQITEEGDMEDLTPVKGAPLKWYNAAIPVSGVILVTIYGLFDTGISASYEAIMEQKDIGLFSWANTWANMDVLGSQAKLGILIGNADSYIALLWASATGVFLAIFMTLAGRIMKLNDCINSMVAGFKAMLPAVLILVLAWALASTTEELFTSNFLTAVFLGKLQPWLLPALIFVLAALISFSTGSSWSTMAILYPLAIPLCWEITADLAEPVRLEYLYNVVATVLAASVLGDHCSPISDTTILSSLATDCNHIDHVRTQMPYALTVGVVSLICGVLATALGGGAMISLILIAVSVLILYLIVKRFGKVVPEHKNL